MDCKFSLFFFLKKKWIANYSNFIFTCQSIKELWCVGLIYIVEMVRGAVICIIWLERNKKSFNEGHCKSVRNIGLAIISYATKESQFNLIYI
jgi:hypothetical protein